ncbi:MAG: flippase-like domain-containing protein [Rhodospirillaceae bacterium]|jgi:glycosyltransferase 2 family protein|nr:flippase-like domain-containing protein [Rhodospirillaceae bacterium]MBT5455251.1 flippase-like domain-containing protein [Rhodospirillaceae bacterium]
MPYWLSTILRLSVSGGIILWLVSRIDLSNMGTRLKDADPWLIVLAFCILLLQSGLAAWRWQRVNRRLEIDLSLAWHIKQFLISLFFGQALPTTIGGDVVRGWQLGRACGSVGIAINSVIIDRGIGFVTLLLLTVISLPFLISQSMASDVILGIVLVIGASVLAVALLLMIKDVPKRLEQHKAVRQLIEAIGVFRNLLLDPRESCVQCAIGLAVHMSSILAFMLLARALQVPLPFIVAIAVLPALLFVAGIPISIAGWGIREGGMVAGFALLGLPSIDALILSIAFGLGELGVGLVGGVLWLISDIGRPGTSFASSASSSDPADPLP